MPSGSRRRGQNRKALPPALFGNVDLALGAVTEGKRAVPYTPVWWGEMWPSIFTYMKKNVALLGNPCNKEKLFEMLISSQVTLQHSKYRAV